MNYGQSVSQNCCILTQNACKLRNNIAFMHKIVASAPKIAAFYLENVAYSPKIILQFLGDIFWVNYRYDTSLTSKKYFK